MIRPLTRKDKVLAVGAVLTGLMGGIGLLTARPSDEALLFTLVPLSGDVEGVGPGSPLNRLYPHRSQIVALNSHKPQGPPKLIVSGFSSTCAPSISYDGRWLLFAGRRAEADSWQTWEARVDGSRLRQVTRGMGDCTDPCYLPDGRIAFSGAVPERRGVRSLFTCARDGSQVERITFGEGYDVKPTVLPDGRILFMRMGDGKSGVPMTVNPDGTGLQRFYGEVQARGHVLSQRPPEARTYGLYEFDPVHHLVGRVLYSDASADAVDPVLAAPRPRPRALTSIVDKTKKTGWLLCLNVYLSRLPEVASLKPGEVKQVQVAAAAWANGRPPVQEERLLGEAAVEKDGSFYVEVPADTPLRLRLLRADGGVVASLNSGVWVRPNENRGCIGCHEDPGLSPENRVPLSVMKPPVFLAYDENEK